MTPQLSLERNMLRWNTNKSRWIVYKNLWTKIWRLWRKWQVCTATSNSTLSASYKEATETDEELEERVRNAEKYKDQAKLKRSQELRRQQTVLEELDAARNVQLSLQQQRGGLEAQKKVVFIFFFLIDLHWLTQCGKQHEKDIAERDTEILRISDAHHIRGYESLPLERQKIISFLALLEDMQKKAAGELERLQVNFALFTISFFVLSASTERLKGEDSRVP